MRVEIDRNRHESPQNATGEGKMAVKKIKVSDASRGKKLYLEGHSLAEVCQAFPGYTRNQWRTLKDRESWDEERAAYERDLMKVVKDKLIESKDQFAESLSSLAEQLHKSVQAGEISFKSVADVEKLLKTIYLHLNDGAEKSQVTVTTGTDWAALAKTLLEAEKKDPTLFEKLGAT